MFIKVQGTQQFAKQQAYIAILIYVKKVSFAWLCVSACLSIAFFSMALTPAYLYSNFTFSYRNSKHLKVHFCPSFRCFSFNKSVFLNLHITYLLAFQCVTSGRWDLKLFEINGWILCVFGDKMCFLRFCFGTTWNKMQLKKLWNVLLMFWKWNKSEIHLKVYYFWTPVKSSGYSSTGFSQ